MLLQFYRSKWGEVTEKGMLQSLVQFNALLYSIDHIPNSVSGKWTLDISRLFVVHFIWFLLNFWTTTSKQFSSEYMKQWRKKNQKHVFFLTLNKFHLICDFELATIYTWLFTRTFDWHDGKILKCINFLVSFDKVLYTK